MNELMMLDGGSLPNTGRIAKVFTDGGVAGPNPSKVGGSWAFVFADEDDNLLGWNAGVVTPGFYGLETISNNTTELLAALFALEAIAPTTGIDVYTDSQVTLTRFTKPTKWEGIPEALRKRVSDVVMKRWQLCTGTGWYLLGGHPTKVELAEGVRADGKPVHKFNVLCDALCGLGAQWLMSPGKPFVPSANQKLFPWLESVAPTDLVRHGRPVPLVNTYKRLEDIYDLVAAS